MFKRVSKKLDGWKKAYLSLGGRLTLSQSVAYVLCYFIFRILSFVVLELDRILRVVGVYASISGRISCAPFSFFNFSFNKFLFPLEKLKKASKGNFLGQGIGQSRDHLACWEMGCGHKKVGMALAEQM